MRRFYREAYSGLPRDAWILALLELVNRSGTMVFFFLTLYMTRRLGFSLAESGRAMSAYGLGAVAGTYFGGRLCDRIGAYHVQKISLAASGVLLIALRWPRAPWTMAAALFLLASAHEALHPANAAATARICRPEIRPKGFALSRLASNLGVSFGPLIGGFLALIDYDWLFWVDGLTSLAAAVLALVLLPMAGPRDGASRRPSRSAWRDIGFLAMLPIIVGVGLLFVQLLNAFPVYMRSVYGLPENAIGGLIAVNTVLIVAIEMLLMHGLRRARPARVASLGTFLLGFGFALLPFGRGAPYAVFTVVVWTMGEILALPMLMTIVSARADESTQGEYQGVSSLGFATAWVIGPSLGMGIYDRFGSDALWYACGLLGIALSLGCSRLCAKAPGQGKNGRNCDAG
ncbi:MAG: MFS transporter [Vicinamibacteria bacterium]|nr:MFS transporter [Vicinamibacteria bacterium]